MTKPVVTLFGLAGLALAAAMVTAGTASGAEENPAAAVKRMTGARTRIVWTRGIPGKGDVFGPPRGGTGPMYQIVAWDTDTGQERELTVEPSNASRPIITPSGRRVLFTTQDRTVWIVDWNGKNLKRLLEGDLAVGVAENPPGTEWVYVAMTPAQPEGFQTVWRFQIDHPAKKEVVWDKTTSIDKWEFTRDGKMAASRFPWTPGTVILPNGDLKAVAQIGCCPGVSADGTTIMHMITVSHNGCYFYNLDGSNRRQISFEGMGGGGEYWWASFARYDPRFMTVCGTFRNHPQVYFFQLNEKKDGIVSWVRISKNRELLNTHAYAWIDSGNTAGSESLTDGLDAKLLAPVVAQLDKAQKVKPTLDRLAKIIETSKNADEVKEAQQVIDHVGEFGKKQVAKAAELETTAPMEALEIYRKLSVQFEGLEAGAAAAQRLQNKDFLDAVKAWDYYERMRRAEKSLKDVAGAKRSATDLKFAAANKTYLDALKNLARLLEQNHSKTAAAEAARKVLAKYDLTL